MKVCKIYCIWMFFCSANDSQMRWRRRLEFLMIILKRHAIVRPKWNRDNCCSKRIARWPFVEFGTDGNGHWSIFIGNSIAWLGFANWQTKLRPVQWRSCSSALPVHNILKPTQLSIRYSTPQPTPSQVKATDSASQPTRPGSMLYSVVNALMFYFNGKYMRVIKTCRLTYEYII